MLAQTLPNDVTAALNPLLAEVFALYLKNFHWYVSARTSATTNCYHWRSATSTPAWRPRACSRTGSTRRSNACGVVPPRGRPALVPNLEFAVLRCNSRNPSSRAAKVRRCRCRLSGSGPNIPTAAAIRAAARSSRPRVVLPAAHGRASRRAAAAHRQSAARSLPAEASTTACGRPDGIRQDASVLRCRSIA